HRVADLLERLRTIAIEAEAAPENLARPHVESRERLLDRVRDRLCVERLVGRAGLRRVTNIEAAAIAVVVRLARREEHRLGHDLPDALRLRGIEARLLLAKLLLHRLRHSNHARLVDERLADRLANPV